MNKICQTTSLHYYGSCLYFTYLTLLRIIFGGSFLNRDLIECGCIAYVILTNDTFFTWVVDKSDKSSDESEMVPYSVTLFCSVKDSISGWVSIAVDMMMNSVSKRHQQYV